MKNAITVWVDSEMSPSVTLSKPESEGQPKNREEAITLVKRDMESLCEGLLTLINMANKTGVLTKEESLDECLEHLKSGFKYE